MEKKGGKKIKRKNKGNNLELDSTQVISEPQVGRGSQEWNKPVFRKTVQGYHFSTINITLTKQD